MKKIVLWVLAVIITLAAAVYQRMTGPTYPLKGAINVEGREVAYRLDRSAENLKDCEVKVIVPDQSVTGFLQWRRFKTGDPHVELQMVRKGEALVGTLLKQPPGGKLEYRVLLRKEDKEYSLTGDKPVVIRFKAAVPAAVLIPHILIMFLAMLFSTRAGLAALFRETSARTLVLVTLALLFLGGFILGPLVQKYSFGVFWSGAPLGFDLTDNKTLIAILFWVAAAVAGRKGRPARGWIVAASVLTLVIFLIPHSLLGTELKYDQPQ
jgi:hypothetical protein